jgi:hypothetical protein
MLSEQCCSPLFIHQASTILFEHALATLMKEQFVFSCSINREQHILIFIDFIQKGKRFEEDINGISN